MQHRDALAEPRTGDPHHFFAPVERDDARTLLVKPGGVLARRRAGVQDVQPAHLAEHRAHRGPLVGSVEQISCAYPRIRGGELRLVVERAGTAH